MLIKTLSNIRKDINIPYNTTELFKRDKGKYVDSIMLVRYQRR